MRRPFELLQSIIVPSVLQSQLEILSRSQTYFEPPCEKAMICPLSVFETHPICILRDMCPFGSNVYTLVQG